MFDFGETVTRLRGTAIEDPYEVADVRIDWTDSDELPIPGCYVSITSSVELPNTDRAPITTAATLYAPSGADVTDQDRIRTTDGTVWSVDGRPIDKSHPLTGWRPGLTATLRLVEG